MTGPVLGLTADDVWTAFDTVDPIAPLVAELTDPAAHSSAALAPWQDDFVLLDGSCLLPAASLRMFHAASLAALAARQLLASGGATVALLGVTPATQPQLAAVARLVPDISHIAVRVTGDVRFSPLEPRLVDQLELNGIGLSVSADTAVSVFGANLVVVFDADLADLRVGQLAPGAVLVNATGEELPDRLTAEVDHVFVDDLRLVGQGTRVHSLCGRSRADRARPSVTADLGQLLSGRHPGRFRFDDVLLVELLGAQALNVRLARQLYRAARRGGLGARLEL